MKSLRELRVRFEPMGRVRPRVYWRKAAPAAGEGGGAAPSLHIELRDGAVYITSPDEPGAGARDAGTEEWEEVSDTRAGWARGIRVAVDFAEEFPDATRTQVGIPIIQAGIPSRRAAEARPVPAADTSTRFFSIEERAAAISAAPEIAAAKVAAPPRKGAKMARAMRMSRPRAVVLALLSLCILGLFAARWRSSVRAQKATRAPERPAAAAPSPTTEAANARSAAHAISDVESAPASDATGAERTKQRRAADAIEMGALSEAAALYDELAREQPDSAVYREAARIMHLQRTAAGRSARAAR